MRRATASPLTLGASLLAASLLLAGCSASGGAARDESGGAPQSVPMEGIAVDGAEIGGDAALEAQADRDVIVTGWMTVTVEDPIAASRDAVSIVERAGGRVDGRTEYAPSNGDAGSANLTLRIPAGDLQAVLDDLADLGRADEISTTSSDVTTYVADLESRIATQRNIIDRLNGMFAQATTIADLITLETSIAEHQGLLEELESQQRQVADQVALSTLSLSLRSEAQAPAPEPGDFVSGLAAGWGAFVGFFSGLLVALGVLLPWIVAAGVVTAAIVLLVRARRRRAAKADASS
jgi:hypothetical protein